MIYLYFMWVYRTNYLISKVLMTWCYMGNYNNVWSVYIEHELIYYTFSNFMQFTTKVFSFCSVMHKNNVINTNGCNLFWYNRYRHLEKIMDDNCEINNFFNGRLELLNQDNITISCISVSWILYYLQLFFISIQIQQCSHFI